MVTSNARAHTHTPLKMCLGLMLLLSASLLDAVPLLVMDGRGRGETCAC